VLVSDFDYELPESLIAQESLQDRSSSRMLHLIRSSGELRDRMFREFPDLLRADDLLVVNNTRVFPARLYGRRSGSRSQPLSPRNPASRDFLHGRVEVLLTRQVSETPNEWECLVRPGRKIGTGERLFFGDGDQLHAEVMARGSFGERRIRFAPAAQDFFQQLQEIGHVPLPPYISRQDRASDQQHYQTVYARERGSVAAPTAGLHFTPEILERIRGRGIDVAELTLHVGLGTFQPVRVKKVEEHRMHGESYSIPPETASKVNRALAQGRRIVAVGTTTVRTLEFAAQRSDATGERAQIIRGSGEANLFIYPGFRYRVVGALLTNFHLPQSTLLMLVSAFASRDQVLSAYRHAVAEKYRFYSYGDCMFVE